MPHSKSATKRLRQSDNLRVYNRSIKRTSRTAIRRYEEALEKKDIATAKTTLSEAFKLLDRAAKKGVIHQNQASRKKSRLALRLKKLEAAG